MKKPSVIIDMVLTLIALFLFAALISGYFIKSGVITVAFSTVFSVCVTFFIGLLSQKRKAPEIRKNKLDGIMNKFIFSPQSYSVETVKKAVATKHSVQEKNGFILAGKTAFYVRLTGEEITNAILVQCYRSAAELKVKRLVIMSTHGANAQTQNNTAMLCDPSVEIWDFTEVYRFLKTLGCEPTQTLERKTKKKRFGAVFANALRRENARKYLFGAIILLVSARFFPYPALYVLLSSVSVVLALLCLLRIPERFFRTMHK